MQLLGMMWDELWTRQIGLRWKHCKPVMLETATKSFQTHESLHTQKGTGIFILNKVSQVVVALAAQEQMR